MSNSIEEPKDENLTIGFNKIDDITVIEFDKPTNQIGLTQQDALAFADKLVKFANK